MKESDKTAITTIAGSFILHTIPFLAGRMLSEGNLETPAAAALLGGAALVYGIGYLFGKKRFTPPYDSEGTRALAEGGNATTNLTSVLLKLASLTTMGYASDVFF